ncbi:hypothetical protein [Enterococcus italicus]|uniref:hypothetical protein n=1 Tax=Enterococcus italicus TaxID=246144 RepID=UPI002073FCF1|nr:hypothetical protein [Enterococcus italicus]
MKPISCILTHAVSDFLSILNCIQSGPTIYFAPELADKIGIRTELLRKRLSTMNTFNKTPLFHLSPTTITVNRSDPRLIFDLFDQIFKEIPELIVLDEVIFQKKRTLLTISQEQPFATSTLSKAKSNILTYQSSQLISERSRAYPIKRLNFLFYFSICLERTLVKLYKDKLEITLPLSYPIFFKNALEITIQKKPFFLHCSTYTFKKKRYADPFSLISELCTEYPFNNTSFNFYFQTFLTTDQINNAHERSFVLFCVYNLLLWYHHLPPFQLVKLEQNSEIHFSNTKSTLIKVQLLQQKLSLPNNTYYQNLFVSLIQRFNFEQKILTI